MAATKSTPEYISPATARRLCILLQEAIDSAASEGADYGDPYEAIANRATKILVKLAGAPVEVPADDLDIDVSDDAYLPLAKWTTKNITNRVKDEDEDE